MSCALARKTSHSKAPAASFFFAETSDHAGDCFNKEEASDKRSVKAVFGTGQEEEQKSLSEKAYTKYKEFEDLFFDYMCLLVNDVRMILAC